MKFKDKVTGKTVKPIGRVHLLALSANPARFERIEEPPKKKGDNSSAAEGE